MLWITLGIATLISLAALAYVVWPLVTRQAPPLAVEDDRLTDLLARKDTVLRSIKELEFDYHVGKLSAEDHQRFGERLNRQAIGLIQQLEKIAPESATLDAMLEAEIAQRRQTVDKTRIPAVATPVVVANGAGSVAQARFCTQCGKRVETTHKFCANCGTPIV